MTQKAKKKEKIGATLEERWEGRLRQRAAVIPHPLLLILLSSQRHKLQRVIMRVCLLQCSLR